MPIYAECKGMIITSEIKTPDEGKPHTLIQVLQNPEISGHKAELTSFKDDDLNNKYQTGNQFNALCRIAEYNFDGRSGQSAKVIQVLGNGSAKPAKRDLA